MAAHLIEPTDIIVVQFVPILIFGPPGSGKTSIAQTASNPLTLDFDKGIHRSFNRKRAMRFDTWADCLQAGEDGDFAAYDTLVIDTGGRALEAMIPGILAEKSSNGFQGNLSPTGWGILGSRFSAWMRTVRSWGKDLVMVCHEETEKDKAGNNEVGPDLPGKMAWKTIHKDFDIIAGIEFQESKRFLECSPREGAKCRKNGAQWESLPIPALEKRPHFLAELIADAKARIGKTAAASAAAAEVVVGWQEWLAARPGINDFNDRLPEVGKLTNGIKAQTAHLLNAYVKEQGWKLDRASKTYFIPDDEPAPAEEGVPA